jgi:hypothetical protein
MGVTGLTGKRVAAAAIITAKNMQCVVAVGFD